MVSVPALLVLLLAAPRGLDATEERVNPIRKVVTMLQNIQAQVTSEGEKQLALYDKFVCYCKHGRESLESGITDATRKVVSLEAKVGAQAAKKKQTEQALSLHQAERADAKDAMAKANHLREKEAAAHAKDKSDYETNIAALAKATDAIENGVTGFVQTSASSIVRTIAIEKADISDDARQKLLSFLSGTGGEGYVPQSGEIVGILKEMRDEMSRSLADATAQEDNAIQTFEALMAAKTKEVAALTERIEHKLLQAGDLGAEIAGLVNDLQDTKEALAEDTQFLAELNGGCDKKAAEWEQMKKTRSDELLALADTIKVLSDDDALELFKKTLPSAAASFVQIQRGDAAARSEALSVLRTARSQQDSPRPQLDLIEMALNGKTIGFGKIIKMIDNMVVNLKGEQGSDDEKKTYCDAQFDATDDKKKGLEQSISDSETAIEELEGSISSLKEEIATLKAGIDALDSDVAEATEQRKNEHADYAELLANDSAAKEVLRFVQNRLNKFYNPRLYVAPPKRELSEEDRVVVSMGGTLAPTMPSGIAGTGITVALVQGKGAPPPPPETFGPYQKKGDEGNGVIAMIDLLIKDLDRELTEAKVTEDDAQADYETIMAESAQKRSQDSKAIVDKGASKASAEEALLAEEDEKTGSEAELKTTRETIHALHGECDFLLKYFDARKAARVGEMDALVNAKATLNGADYSLIEVSRHSQK